jgi:hypothetical protein
LKAIEECRETYDGENDPDHVLIYGESRLGKTTISKTYQSLHPLIITDTDNRMPVLRVGTPVPATIDSLISEALDALGDGNADKGRNLGKKKRRLVKLLIQLQVELIIWDEFQHILEATIGTSPSLVINWVKDLMNKIPVAMVMIGMPGSVRVVTSDDQLNARISERIEMHRFGWKKKGEKKEFKRLLLEIDQCLPFENLVGLINGDMPDRFYDASNGNLGFLIKLIRKTARKEIKAGENTFHFETLANVWEKSIKSSIKDIENPFVLYEEEYKGIPRPVVYRSGNKYGENNRWKPTKRKIPITQLLSCR